MAKKPNKRHLVVQPLDPSYRYIPLTQGQNAIVDTEDFNWLSQWHWHASWNNCTQSFYANRRFKRGEPISMHRMILACTTIENVDHTDGNTLNNRRNNLRKCTYAQNNWNKPKGKNNTSGFKGVTWHKQNKCWLGQIMVDGKHIHLGSFHAPEEAARAYDLAAKIHFGEFALVNFH